MALDKTPQLHGRYPPTGLPSYQFPLSSHAIPPTMALLLSICILLRVLCCATWDIFKVPKSYIVAQKNSERVFRRGGKLHSAMSGSFWWAELLIIMQICANFKLFSSFNIICMKDRQALSNQI